MQVDYIIVYRRAYLKDVGDCKMIAGDNVAKHHRLLVSEPGRSTLNVLNYKYKYFPPGMYLSTIN